MDASHQTSKTPNNNVDLASDLASNSDVDYQNSETGNNNIKLAADRGIDCKTTSCDNNNVELVADSDVCSCRGMTVAFGGKSLLNVLQLGNNHQGLLTATGTHLQVSPPKPDIQQQKPQVNQISIDDDDDNDDDDERRYEDSEDLIETIKNSNGTMSDEMMDVGSGLSSDHQISETNDRTSDAWNVNDPEALQTTQNAGDAPSDETMGACGGSALDNLAGDENATEDEDEAKRREMMQKNEYRRKSINTKRRSFRLSRDGRFVDNLDDEAVNVINEGAGDDGQDSAADTDEDADLAASSDGSQEATGRQQLDSIGSLPDVVSDSSPSPATSGIHPIFSICDKDMTNIPSGNTSDGEGDQPPDFATDDNVASTAKPTFKRMVSFKLPQDDATAAAEERPSPATQRSDETLQSDTEGALKRQTYQRKSSGYITAGSSKDSSFSSLHGSACQDDDEVFRGETEAGGRGNGGAGRTRRVTSGLGESEEDEDTIDETSLTEALIKLQISDLMREVDIYGMRGVRRNGESYDEDEEEEVRSGQVDEQPAQTQAPIPDLAIFDPTSSAQLDSYNSSTDTVQRSNEHKSFVDNTAKLPIFLLGMSVDADSQSERSSSSGATTDSQSSFKHTPLIPQSVEDFLLSDELSSTSASSKHSSLHREELTLCGHVESAGPNRRESSMTRSVAGHMTCHMTGMTGAVASQSHGSVRSASCDSVNAANISSHDQVQRHYEKTRDNFCKEYLAQVLSSDASVEEIAKELQRFPAFSSSSSASDKLQLYYLPSSSGTGSSSGSDIAAGSPYTPYTNVFTPGHDLVFQYSVEVRPEGLMYEDGDTEGQSNVIQQLVMAAQCQEADCPDELCKQGQKCLHDLQDLVDQRGGHDLRYHLQILDCLRRHSDMCDEPKCAVPWCSYLHQQPESLDLRLLLREMQIDKLGKMMQPIFEKDGRHKYIQMSHTLPHTSSLQEATDLNSIAPLGKFGNTFLAMTTSVDTNQLYCVVKKVPDQRHHRDVFTSLRNMDHPFIVSHLWAVCGGCHSYICTKYIPSGSLKDKLAEAGRGCLTNQNVIYFLRQLVEAAIFLHQHGIAYLNWTTSNLLVDCGSQRIMLGDLSIAVRVSQEWTEDDLEDVMLTIPPTALPPEIYDGRSNISAQTDMWGLGTIAYELCQGHGLFHAYRHLEPIEMRKNVGQMSLDDLPVFSGLTEENVSLWRLIKRCLESDPDKRITPVDFKHLLSQL